MEAMNRYDILPADGKKIIFYKWLVAFDKSKILRTYETYFTIDETV